MKKLGSEITARDDDAQSVNEKLYESFSQLLPKLGPNWHRHSLVGLKVEALARTIYYSELYRKILGTPGVICEFGVQYGATMAQLINLRSIYEPFNHSRKIYGFDTFEGFPSVDPRDGLSVEEGDYGSYSGDESLLYEILSLHEKAAPLAHIQKFELVKGDVTETFPEWSEKNRHKVIAMAIFDMDLYQPTKEVLERIRPFLTKGSLLVFDEVNCDQFPGETIALKEVFPTESLRLCRTPLQPFCSWAVWGE